MARNNNKRSIAPVLMIGLGFVLITILVIWLLVVSKSLPASTTTASEESPNPNLPRVSLADAKAAYDSKSAVFVDVRNADSYTTKHIQGAINFPLDTLKNQTHKLNPNQWIITYCT